ncbi:MAG: protein kinase [bacterium]|nr:protein kinase [bacterium]
MRMKKYVVLKKIHDYVAGSSMDIRSELDILKKLRHSYLPPVLDFIEDNGAVYTVMDYIQGESFESLLKKGVRFTQAQTMKYARQLGEVLVYLHEQNPPIVHGDIKPANLMLTPEDNICLIDFNISQVKNGGASLNMGYTPGYAAPEQVKIVEEIKRTVLLNANNRDGTVLLNTQDKTVLLNEENRTGTLLLYEEAERSRNTANPANISVSTALARQTIDERTDIYSAGATLYALLLGHAPNSEENNKVTGGMQECSEGLANLINRCMAYRPEKRFQSAQEFLKAALGIAKVDKRYRHLVLRQELAAILCMAGIAGGVILSFLGHEKMGEEKKETYDLLISEMEDYRETGGDQTQFEEIYNEATAMFPDNAEAYYQRAWYLYEKRQFDEIIEYLSEDISDRIWEFSDEEKGSMYFLLANGYMEIKEFDSALGYYRQAVGCNPYETSYYADYAIALAMTGQISEASQILEKAVGLGGGNDRILLAQGELSGRQGRLEEAENYFRQCLSETNDAYITLRAYVMWSGIYDDTAAEQGLLRKAEILTEGLDAVGKDNRAIILEQLAQTHIDLAELTQQAEYNRKAIENLQEIAALGWDTYLTHHNIGILYEKLGDYDAAGAEFENMLSVYGEDYRTYKRLAFLELDIQTAQDNSERDYMPFLEYYDAAQRLFADSGMRADSDMEMSLLDQAYEQLKEGNWL